MSDSFEPEFAAPGSDVVVAAALDPGRGVVVNPIPIHEFEIA